MPMIKQFSENAPVGVLKPCCTISADRIRALTASRPIKPTSTRCPSAWQPNPGRGSTYRRGKAVQTTGTTSKPAARPFETPDECLVAEICIDEYLWSLYERTPKIDTNKVTEQVKETVEKKGKMRTIVK